MQASPPILILPSREQDYTDPYFRAIFSKAVRVLRETRVLIIVGYSMPREDALILFILRQLAESVEYTHGKYIFCIDLKAPDILDRCINWILIPYRKMDGQKCFTTLVDLKIFAKKLRINVPSNRQNELSDVSAYGINWRNSGQAII